MWLRNKPLSENAFITRYIKVNFTTPKNPHCKRSKDFNVYICRKLYIPDNENEPYFRTDKYKHI